ncbi:MAG: OmpA family protein [Betaproteobacteria bacterium]|nr:OmpA family protein [Betaproteobacteria bacterium]
MKALTFLVAIVCFAAAAVVHAQTGNVADFGDKEITKGDVLRALSPSLKTRGLTIGQEEPKDAAAAKDAPAGTAAAAPGAAPAAVATTGPRKLSLQLQFGLNSAELTPGARRRLDAIGEALAAAELAQAKFVISGHTDVSGSYDYNLRLSRRRADAVKVYLVSAHDVAPERLKAVGRGPDELLDEDNPKSPANRRVQLAVVE